MPKLTAENKISFTGEDFKTIENFITLLENMTSDFGPGHFFEFADTWFNIPEVYAALLVALDDKELEF